jgi:hypothetical protein
LQKSELNATKLTLKKIFAKFFSVWRIGAAILLLAMETGVGGRIETK